LSYKYDPPLTADQRIDLIRVRTARAHQHIQDLDREIREFLNGEPYKVAIKPDPQFPHVPQLRKHYLVSVRPMTTVIPLFAGEAIHNIRIALDYLVNDLVDIGCTAQNITLSKTERRQIAFPIIDTDSPKEYQISRKRKVKGMMQAAIDAIDATKPYKGGNDLLWKLSQLNNIDKHRFLITVGSQIASFNAPRWIRRGMARHILEEKGVNVPPDVDLSQILNFSIIPDDRKCPLNEGDELVAGFSEILDHDEKMRFTFDIVFYELGVAECEPILPLLMQFLNYVNDLILSFRRYLI